MPLTETFIDEASRQTLLFKRRISGALDASGNPAAPSWTLLATEYGDIQPEQSNLRDTPYGTAENIPGKGEITHSVFVESRVSGVDAKDYVQDENGKMYLIVSVNDFRGAPQDFRVRIVTDQEI